MSPQAKARLLAKVERTLAGAVRTDRERAEKVVRDSLLQARSIRASAKFGDVLRRVRSEGCCEQQFPSANLTPLP
ncbi:MAG TPA: hypothetical protein PK177_19095 [Burkholderiaceae bacterium]|nr:hypothetical protein [Burkholderiaceae bacterium]